MAADLGVIAPDLGLQLFGRKLPGQELLVDGDLCQLLGREVGAVLLCEDRGGIGTLLGQFGDDFQYVGIGQLGDFRARGLGLDDILLGIGAMAPRRTVPWPSWPP